MTGMINEIEKMMRECKYFRLNKELTEQFDKHIALYNNLDEKLYYLDQSLEYLAQFAEFNEIDTNKIKIKDIHEFYDNLEKIHSFVGVEVSVQYEIFAKFKEIEEAGNWYKMGA